MLVTTLIFSISYISLRIWIYSYTFKGRAQIWHLNCHLHFCFHIIYFEKDVQIGIRWAYHTCPAVKINILSRSYIPMQNMMVQNYVGYKDDDNILNYQGFIMTIFRSITNNEIISAEFIVDIIFIFCVVFQCWNNIIFRHIYVCPCYSILQNWLCTCVKIACKRSRWVLICSVSWCYIT